MKVGSLVERTGEFGTQDILFAARKNIIIPKKSIPYTVKDMFIDDFGDRKCMGLTLEECNGIYRADLFTEIQSPEEGLECIKDSIPELLEVVN